MWVRFRRRRLVQSCSENAWQNSRLRLQACAAWRDLGHHLAGHNVGREEGMLILKEDLLDSVVPGCRRKRKTRDRSTMVKGFSSWLVKAVELLTKMVELYQLKRPHTVP